MTDMWNDKQRDNIVCVCVWVSVQALQPRFQHSCTLPAWLYQTLWHDFNSNADLMGHNQHCLLTGSSETIAIGHKLRECNTNTLKSCGTRKSDSFIHSPLLWLHQQQIWCGNMSSGDNNPVYKCKIVCFSLIATHAVFVTGIGQLNWIPKDSGGFV